MAIEDAKPGTPFPDPEPSSSLAPDNVLGKRATPHTASLNPDPAERLAILQEKCRAVDEIVLKLPTRALTAGKVLGHAIATMQSYFRKHEPLIFKVGWTHDPVWRWTNTLYGYAHGRDKWSEMVILYGSHEPWGPAMLEAALIEKFGSYSTSLCLLVLALIQHGVSCSMQFGPGRPGCRNVQKGGDTVQHGPTSENGFMTYMVYRSFKFPPTGPNSRTLNEGTK